jgi:hypothetical protein
MTSQISSSFWGAACGTSAGSLVEFSLFFYFLPLQDNSQAEKHVMLLHGHEFVSQRNEEMKNREQRERLQHGSSALT